MPLTGYTPEEQAASDVLNAKLVHLNAQVNTAIADVRATHPNVPMPTTVGEIASVVEEVLPSLEAVAQAARLLYPRVAGPVAAALLPVIHAAEVLAEWLKTYNATRLEAVSEEP